MKHAALICALVALISCNRKPDDPDDLPQVRHLSEFKQTEFVETLENTIQHDKNSVYSSVLLLAMDEGEKRLKSPAVAGPEHPQEFNWLVNSTSHMGSLSPNEYELDLNVEGEITAGVKFEKTLPFDVTFRVIPDGMMFEKTKVLAFGADYDDPKVLASCKILYYKDDNNFIIQLIPKDTSESIMLMKGLGPFPTLGEGYKKLHEYMERGAETMKDAKHAWKYEFNEMDDLTIPMIRFNIEAHFENLEGLLFRCENKEQHSFEEAYVRIGFLLNERGAVVEMDGRVAYDSIGGPEVVLKKHPKKLIMDKPFLIVLKKSQQKNPYLVMRIQNAELLIPEKVK